MPTSINIVPRYLKYFFTSYYVNIRQIISVRQYSLGFMATIAIYDNTHFILCPFQNISKKNIS